MTNFRVHHSADEDDDSIEATRPDMANSLEATKTQPGALTLEHLASLQFKNGPNAMIYLQSLALQSHFPFSAWNTLTGDVIQLYCYPSERSPKYNTRRKTNCLFHTQLNL
jgi:hypothetical protein